MLPCSPGARTAKPAATVKRGSPVVGGLASASATAPTFRTVRVRLFSSPSSTAPKSTRSGVTKKERPDLPTSGTRRVSPPTTSIRRSPVKTPLLPGPNSTARSTNPCPRIVKPEGASDENASGSVDVTADTRSSETPRFESRSLLAVRSPTSTSPKSSRAGEIPSRPPATAAPRTARVRSPTKVTPATFRSDASFTLDDASNPSVVTPGRSGRSTSVVTTSAL